MLRNVTFLHNATILHFAAWLGNTFKRKLMPDLRVPKKKTHTHYEWLWLLRVPLN